MWPASGCQQGPQHTLRIWENDYSSGHVMIFDQHVSRVIWSFFCIFLSCGVWVDQVPHEWLLLRHQRWPQGSTGFPIFCHGKVITVRHVVAIDVGHCVRACSTICACRWGSLPKFSCEKFSLCCRVLLLWSIRLWPAPRICTVLAACGHFFFQHVHIYFWVRHRHVGSIFCRQCKCSRFSSSQRVCSLTHSESFRPCEFIANVHMSEKAHGMFKQCGVFDEQLVKIRPASSVIGVKFVKFRRRLFRIVFLAPVTMRNAIFSMDLNSFGVSCTHEKSNFRNWIMRGRESVLWISKRVFGSVISCILLSGCSRIRRWRRSACAFRVVFLSCSWESNFWVKSNMMG